MLSAVQLRDTVRLQGGRRFALPAGDSVEQDAVLFANEAFYRAFAARDLAAMEDLWARDCPVACIHPGWGPLFGRDAVMQSWRGILGNPDSPAVACHAPRAFVYGTTAFVTCFESLSGGFLIATNVFVRAGAVWKLVHHQAGPTGAHPEEEAGADTPERPN